MTKSTLMTAARFRAAAVAVAAGLVLATSLVAAPAALAAPVGEIPEGGVNSGTVKVWGYPTAANVPAGLTDAVAIAAGALHAMALRADGTVIAWGQNPAGQATVPVGLSDVVAIAAGNNHSLALRRDGTVVAWGSDAAGQATVPADLNEVVAISAGYRTSLALRSDGTVAAWGSNDTGVLTFAAALTNVTAISAGYSRALALHSDGTVSSSSSISPPSDLTGVTAIAAGFEHFLALRADRTVVAWGFNTDGQATVPAGLDDVTAIAAGRAYSLALRSGGTVVAWGTGLYGVGEAPRLTGVVAIAAGGDHALALVSAPAPADAAAPVAAPTQDPAVANAAGWNNTPVTVTWNWADEGGSGIDPANCTTSTTVTSGTQNLTATCPDLAGNVGTAQYVVKIDTIAPTLNPSLVPAAANNFVLVGATGIVASPGASDTGSQVATASCRTVDTATAGAKTLTCTATDNAGNTTTKTVAYTVGYTVTVPSTQKKTFNSGSTYNFAFTLTGANGQKITAATGGALASGCGAKVTLGTLAPVCATFDATTGTFTASIKTDKTMSNGNHPITIAVTSQGFVVATGTSTATATK